MTVGFVAAFVGTSLGAILGVFSAFMGAGWILPFSVSSM